MCSLPGAARRVHRSSSKGYVGLLKGVRASAPGSLVARFPCATLGRDRTAILGSCGFLLGDVLGTEAKNQRGCRTFLLGVQLPVIRHCWLCTGTICYKLRHSRLQTPFCETQANCVNDCRRLQASLKKSCFAGLSLSLSYKCRKGLHEAVDPALLTQQPALLLLRHRAACRAW